MAVIGHLSVGIDVDEVQMWVYHFILSYPISRRVDPLNDAPGEVHEVAKDAARICGVVAGDDEWLGMAGRVGGDEARFRQERAPRLADGAEAAEVLGREAQQDLVQRVQGPRLDTAPSVRTTAPARRRRRHARCPRDDGPLMVYRCRGRATLSSSQSSLPQR